MTFSDIFWLLFLIFAFQPFIRQRFLEQMRARSISRIEKERRSRVILLVHRQETMRLFGFPLVRYIDISDAEAVLRALQLTDAEIPIDLVLHTPGGLVLPSLQIARAIKARAGKVTVFVPHYAMSGGTLIALAADEIVMCQHAVLGPVDPQIGEYPAASLLRAVDQKPVADIDDRTLVLADVARKAIEQIRTAIEELLTGTMPPETATQTAELLSQGTWTHDYPITPVQARQLGLRISTDMPSEILDLLSLFPQPVRRQEGVEYLPGPKERRAEGEGRRPRT